MKKIMVIIMCCCLCFSSFAYAKDIKNEAFSIELPDGYEETLAFEGYGSYTLGDRTITYTYEKSEAGSYFKDVEEIKDEGGFALMLLGFYDSEIETIKNTKFLRAENEILDEKTISYLATTSKYLVDISFEGDFDEQEVRDIMKTFKIKGMSAMAYQVLANVGYYVVIGAVVIGVGVLSKRSKAKKKQKEQEKLTNNLGENMGETIPTNDPYAQVKDEWKL